MKIIIGLFAIIGFWNVAEIVIDYLVIKFNK